MGAERKGSKNGGYVGGFLQLFDWNAKSRKKLFSSKSDVPEQSKQKKRCDGNFPKTRIHLVDEDESVRASSLKGSSDYSCASSVTDEDVCGARAPGVVARLMGLDSLPTSNFSESCSTPFSDSQSLRDFRYHSGNSGYHEDQIMFSGNLRDKIEVPVRNMIEAKYQKSINRPVEKFQTEVLPPKSAKSIPITHHKLLSPIKSSNFIPSKDAAHIMEAAARIIEPGPQVSAKVKMSAVGSSSLPLKVRDLKEKVEAAQRRSKLADACRKSSDSGAAKYLKGQFMNKSWNGSVDTTSMRISSDSEECSTGSKNKGKSISLALQAKANVQKREGLSSNGTKNVVMQKEPAEVMSNHLFKSQPSTQKNTQKKSPAQGASSVLRQNNQKQNCLVDVGKSPSKPFAQMSQGRKGSGYSSCVRQRSSNKTVGNCKAGSRRLGSDVTKEKNETSYSGMKNLSRKKRCLNGDFQFEKNQAADNILVDKSGKLIQSESMIDRQISRPQESKRNATDIVSFTFTAPMTRSVFGMEASSRVGSLSADNDCKREMQSSDSLNSLNLSSFSKSMFGGDALSTLLEQKLRELTHAVEASQQKVTAAGTSKSIFSHLMPDVSAINASTTLQDQGNQYMIGQFSSGISSTDSQGLAIKQKQEREGQLNNYVKSDTTVKPWLDCRLPSPISVLEPSFFAESCNSSETADSIFSTGGSKLCSSVQAQDVLGTSLKRLHLVEVDSDLSDSASSTSSITVAGKKLTTSSIVSLGQTTNWELEYVKEILRNVELMFEDFTLGRACNIINPHLFDQLEGRKEVMNYQCPEHRLKRRVLFDCVSECIDLRCRRYAIGGCTAWGKGLLVVRRKEKLAEEVYNEISGWSGMGNCMVDELVDKDMSNKFGRWVDFEYEAFELGLQIENRLLNSLIDEVVTDILVL